MTTEVSLQDSKIMKTIIEPMVAVGDDIFIEISDKGFRAQTRAVGNTWAADAFLDRSLFSTINIDSTTIYSIKLRDFADFIKTIQSNDELVIREDEEMKSLVMELKSDQMTKKLVLRLQSVPEDYKFMEILDKEFPTNATLQVDLFAQAVRTAELGGEEVELTHSIQNLEFKAESTTRSSEANISYENDEKVTDIQFTDANKSHAANYKLDYLHHIARVGKSDDRILLSMANNGPLRLVYTFKEEVDEEKLGYLSFAVAPRIKNPDEA